MAACTAIGAPWACGPSDGARAQRDVGVCVARSPSVVGVGHDSLRRCGGVPSPPASRAPLHHAAANHGWGLSVGGVITLVGPLSGEVRLILESPTGVRLAQLALVIPGPEALVDAQDTATIRMDAPNTIVRRNGSGEETNVYHWRPLALNSGWWKVSPEHADRWNGQYPRARLSTGSGWWRYHLAEAA